MTEEREKILKDVDTYPRRNGVKSLVSSAGVSKAIAVEKSRAITAEERLEDEIEKIREDGCCGATGWTGWTGPAGADGTGWTGWTGWTGPRGLPGSRSGASLPKRTVITSGHDSEIELTFVDGTFHELDVGWSSISRTDIIAKGERGTDELSGSFRYQYSETDYVILNPGTEEMSGGTAEFTWTATPDSQTISTGTITAEEGTIEGFRECFDVCAEYMRDAIASNINSISQLLLKIAANPILPLTVEQGESKFRISIAEDGESPMLKVERMPQED